MEYSIVVPVYNEEDVIMASYIELRRVMDMTKEEYELIFVNDGSRDNTAAILESICQKDSRAVMLDFSRNFGHQIAITAGMDFSRGRAVLVIDADLQDPPEVMLSMIEKWKEGYEVVYGKRLKRDGESFFKKITAIIYYRFLSKLTKVSIPVDTGDFRLIDRKVCDALKSVREKNRYIRGIVAWLGYKQTAVEYDRQERFAGVTKYPLKKMLRLALDGIVSFSDAPLKLPYLIGGVVLVCDFLYLLVTVWLAVVKGAELGNMPVFFMILLIQGATLITLGFMGEYISRTIDETRNRPLYLISRVVQKEGGDE